jgi:hypothetical protein
MLPILFIWSVVGLLSFITISKCYDCPDNIIKLLVIIVLCGPFIVCIFGTFMLIKHLIVFPSAWILENIIGLKRSK